MACLKKSKKKDIFFCSFSIFLLQDNSYSCLVLKFQAAKLKIAIEVIKIINLAVKVPFSKKLITSKLIDLAT